MVFDFVLSAARHLLHCYDLGSKGDENVVSLLVYSHPRLMLEIVYSHPRLMLEIHVAAKLLLISICYKVWRN